MKRSTIAVVLIVLCVLAVGAVILVGRGPSSPTASPTSSPTNRDGLEAARRDLATELTILKGSSKRVESHLRHPARAQQLLFPDSEVVNTTYGDYYVWVYAEADKRLSTLRRVLAQVAPDSAELRLAVALQSQNAARLDALVGLKLSEPMNDGIWKRLHRASESVTSAYVAWEATGRVPE